MLPIFSDKLALTKAACHKNRAESFIKSDDTTLLAGAYQIGINHFTPITASNDRRKSKNKIHLDLGQV